MTVTLQEREALVRAYRGRGGPWGGGGAPPGGGGGAPAGAYRERGSLRFAARQVGVAQSEAYGVLRSEGFDLETRDWFFESGTVLSNVGLEGLPDVLPLALVLLHELGRSE